MRPAPIEIAPALLGTVRGGEDPPTPTPTPRPPPPPVFSPAAPIRRRVEGSWRVDSLLGTMSGEGEAVVSRTDIGACLESDSIENCVKYKERRR